MGNNFGSTDVTVVKQTSYAQIVLALIRPIKSNRRFQLVFLFGDKRWRKRRCMQASALSVAFPSFDRRNSEANSDFDIMCSCVDYIQCKKCVHYDAVFMDVGNKMRIFGLGFRGISATCFMHNIDKWESLQFPVLDGDDVYAWQIFKRKSTSSIFQSSATVLHRVRRHRRHLRPLNERLFCCMCHGVSTRS